MPGSSKGKHAKVRCPCCEKPRSVSELTELEESIARRQVRPWWAGDGWVAALARRGELQWACEACRRAHRAVLASPWLQLYCDHPPLLAYFDRALRCEDCLKPFTFGASEQRYWYEQLAFWVQSVPKHCAPCRRARRQRNRAQAVLAEVLSTLDPKDPAQLAKAAAALVAVGSRRKAAEYLRRAKNLTPDEGARRALVKDLESLGD